MPTRPVLDRCPGVLQALSAADGAIVRLRLPGGRTSARELADIADLAVRHGAPFVQLTSRGNLQLRALPDPLPTPVVEAVEAMGLLPSAMHERVRNIVADPSPALDELITRLDARIRDSPALADLSGRWLFALADRTAHALRSPYDVGYQRVSPTAGYLVVDGRARRCAPEDAVEAMIRMTHAFLATRPGPHVWNMRDLPSDDAIFDGFADAAGDAADESVAPAASVAEFGVPLGFCTPDLSHALVETVGREAVVVVTHRRSLIVREALTPCQIGALLDAGFCAADDPTLRVTACIGAPHCRRTSAPTLDLARSLPVSRDIPRTHLVGCERACGRPKSAHCLVVEPRTLDDVLDAIGVS